MSGLIVLLCINTVHAWKLQLGVDTVLWLLHFCATQVFNMFYTITWLLCAFSLVVDHDLLEDTHTDGVKSTSDSRQHTCFSFFMPPKSFNKPFEFLLHKTNNVDYIFPCVRVYCNRSQKTSQCVKNKSVMPLDFVSCHTFCSLHTVMSSVI